ncbi:hypothetical protein I5677_05785 [Mobilitalea sibirica]|uniref:Lipid-binding hydrolase n=1 Tax=Mobilitalea sibirica TaxID=1462919 RepID=A0A8J7KWH3_9FIRM|nr:hypothetical protein [Mobilitalea sibirica]MBH1940407.1 hypothetical protein [Mobilitalea sibirica]
MRIKLTIMTIILITAFLSGCANNDNNNATPTPTLPPDITDDITDGDTNKEVDAVTSASIVDTEEDFLYAISANGTWIICALKDFTFDEEIVLDGEFMNGKQDDDGKDIVQRKIALYTQDENRNVTNKFTLTAPLLKVNSPNASLQRGTFKGDILVTAWNFELVDMVVEGNIYFTTEDAINTFTMDETSSVTGVQELQKDQ